MPWTNLVSAGDDERFIISVKFKKKIIEKSFNDSFIIDGVCLAEVREVYRVFLFVFVLKKK